MRATHTQPFLFFVLKCFLQKYKTPTLYFAVFPPLRLILDNRAEAKCPSYPTPDYSFKIYFRVIAPKGCSFLI